MAMRPGTRMRSKNAAGISSKGRSSSGPPPPDKSTYRPRETERCASEDYLRTPRLHSYVRATAAGAPTHARHSEKGIGVRRPADHYEPAEGYFGYSHWEGRADSWSSQRLHGSWLNLSAA